MYTKEQLKQIVNDFVNSEFYDKSLMYSKHIRQALNRVNKRWPGLMHGPKVLMYWIDCCTNDNFIDTLHCENCGTFMNNRQYEYPKYCSTDCRKANHNWKKGTESRAKLEQKWKDKYGCINPLGAKEVRDKVKQTNLERYGSEHNWGKNSTVWNKIKQTNLDKYGTEYVVQSEHFRETSKETLLERYGVDSPAKSRTVQEKMRKTCQERYGAPNVRNRGSSLLEKMKQDCLEKYGVPYYCMTEQCRHSLTKTISKVNKEFETKLRDKGFDVLLEHRVGWYSYDLYLPDINLLIDINPSFTHSVTPGISRFKPKHKEYHYNRYKNAIVNSYKLLQIWDWDDKDKILKNLDEAYSIGARLCDLRELTSDAANAFLDSYHFQGKTKTFTNAYGLFYEGQLVQLMTFGKPRYNKNHQYELLRLCTKPGYAITGGSKRLLSHFEHDVQPKSIISYCDLSKFDGKVYQSLGFIEQGYSLSKHWYNYRQCKHITDNLLRQLGADKLIGTNYGKGTFNEDIMLLNGYIEVYDAGQMTFVKSYDR